MTDFFVAAGATAGDCTRARPSHDPWLALRQAAPGDRIHIAAGTYTGRGERSSWVVDTPDLTVLGGYSPDFATRSPWRTPTVFAARADLRVPHEPNMIQGIGDHDGLVLDGLFFDAAGRSEYDEQGGLVRSSYGDGAIVGVRGERITLRNCVFANGSTGAVELGGNNGVFENNLVVNCLGLSLLSVRDSDPEAPSTVSRNTFAFAHDDSDPPKGSGADRASGVRVNSAATIADNVFVGCGNAAIACFRDVGQVAVDRNLFFATLRDIVRSRVSSAEAEVTEEYVGELEDVGLRSAAGNTVGDAQLTGLPTAWLDAYTVDIAATYERPPLAALNALRKACGLGDLPSTSDSDAQRPVMRRLAPAEVLAIAVGAAQGSHPADLPDPGPYAERKPDPVYQTIDWARLYQADPALTGTSVQVRAGVGFDQNLQIIPELAETHIGVAVYEPGTDNTPWWALAPRYGMVHHQTEDAVRYPRRPRRRVHLPAPRHVPHRCGDWRPAGGHPRAGLPRARTRRPARRVAASDRPRLVRPGRIVRRGRPPRDTVPRPLSGPGEGRRGRPHPRRRGRIHRPPAVGHVAHPRTQPDAARRVGHRVRRARSVAPPGALCAHPGDQSEGRVRRSGADGRGLRCRPHPRRVRVRRLNLQRVLGHGSPRRGPLPVGSAARPARRQRRHYRAQLRLRQRCVLCGADQRGVRDVREQRRGQHQWHGRTPPGARRGPGPSAPTLYSSPPTRRAGPRQDSPPAAACSTSRAGASSGWSPLCSPSPTASPCGPPCPTRT